MPSIHEWVACKTNDGKLLPIDLCNHYRSIKGLPNLVDPPNVKDRPKAKAIPSTNASVHPKSGPGTELKKILDDLGFKMKSSCQCNARQLQMNTWGAKGCQEHREEILAWLKDAATTVHTLEKVTAVWYALKHKILFNPLNPYESILDLAISRANKMSALKWSYGVTTVPSRIDTALPVTLQSLQSAGFDSPRLFVDNCFDPKPFERFHLELTTHWPKLQVNGNWVLSILELYVRQPEADRYVIFQDDLVTYHNLREYLEQIPYPENGYCNLYTAIPNERYAQGHKGWFRTRLNSEQLQAGLGAVALMFSREALKCLFDTRHMLDKFHGPDPMRRVKCVDGGIVTAMNKVGWYEYCHMPTLTYHIGDESVCGNDKHPKPQTFRGEHFNALEFLQK